MNDPATSLLAELKNRLEGCGLYAAGTVGIEDYGVLDQPLSNGPFVVVVDPYLYDISLQVSGARGTGTITMEVTPYVEFHTSWPATKQRLRTLLSGTFRALVVPRLTMLPDGTHVLSRLRATGTVDLYDSDRDDGVPLLHGAVLQLSITANSHYYVS